MRASGVRVPSRTAVWRFFRRHEITFRKTLRAAEQERADVARARRRWMREQGKFDPARLVFIDETSANTKMVRLYGRCARGERLVGHVPQGHWKTITFVAALRRRGMRAAQTIDGAIAEAQGQAQGDVAERTDRSSTPRFSRSCCKAATRV